MKTISVRGIHYQSPPVYDFFTLLKLRRDYHLRYRIAAQYIKPGESVLDVCAGYGEFRKFIPLSCRYQAVDASPSFVRELARRDIPYRFENLHDGLDTKIPAVDVLVMIISLCQFQNTSLEKLLEDFKKIASKVVIVEDVQNKTPWFVEKFRDYLCATDYYLPMQLFSADQFQAVMKQHGYGCQKYNERYWVGYFEGGKEMS